MSAMSNRLAHGADRFEAARVRWDFLLVTMAGSPRTPDVKGKGRPSWKRGLSIPSAARRYRWLSGGTSPRVELRLEHGFRRPADRARVGVERSEALPAFQRFLLNLADPLSDDCIRRRVAGSDDLVSGEQLIVHRRSLQARRAVGPLHEMHEILFAGIDPRVPDDPQESDDSPEGRQELVLPGNTAEPAPPFEGFREGVFLRAGELARRDFLDDREKLELALKSDSFGDALERGGDEVEHPR